MVDHKSDVSYDCSLSARPVVAAAWRGRLNIPRLNLDINISAHVSNKACFKVLEVASRMPESLCLEMVPRLDVWPASFTCSPPTEHSVALFFFSKGRDEEILDSLLNYAICADIALKAMIGNAELLIFTSLQLPEKLHKFHGKFYLWGVFKGQEASSSHQSDYHVQIQTTKARKSSRKSLITMSSNSSPSSCAAKADKRGRRLDGAWDHAKPLDLLRQKAECRYCGFVSTHGGISRLKAHLAGGNPKFHLPGCNMVPPQVKKFMADWFVDWLKNTKAVWTKEVKGTVMRGETRGRPLDDGWEYGKPLDRARQITQCSYCGYVSKYGGISRLKAHLGGGCPQMHLQGCPQVPVHVKNVMQQWFNEWANNSKAVWTRKSRVEIGSTAEPSKRGRPLDDVWEHAIPLDEMRQATKCRYCGFVSNFGGIARLKAHLLGGDPKMQLEGCPNASLEVKLLMAEGMEKYRKKAKGVTVASVEDVSQEDKPTALEAQWFEKRQHVLQETFEEVRNTSLKESLRKILDEKNAKVQRMQLEILSLQSHLASMH